MSYTRQKGIDALRECRNDLEDEIDEARQELEILKEKARNMDDMMRALAQGEDVDEDEFWEITGEEYTNPVPIPDEERGVISALLDHASLTGGERSDLEDMICDDNLLRERYQEIYNAHLSVIHAAQRNSSSFA